MTGGVVGDKAAEVFDALIKSLKKYDYPLESAIDIVENDLSFDNPLFTGTNAQEAVDYIKANWDAL